MTQIQLRFYAELNDLIAPALRNTEIIHNLNRRTSVKDMIESLGVPHTEIALILANGISVDFTYIVQYKDRIRVYPSSANLNVAPLLQLRPETLLFPRFIVDVNLGRLARYLRLLGFDCLYSNNYSDEAIAKTSNLENRVVLTRDRILLLRKMITQGYFVRASIPKAQVKEVLKRFSLYRLVNPFVRCTHCNAKLKKIKKQEIAHRLEALTKQHYDTFLVCSACNQIYWQGSHYMHAKRLVDEFLNAD